MSNDVQKSRLTKAMLVVCGLLAAIPISGFMGSFDTRAPDAASGGGLRAAGLISAFDAIGSLELVESAAAAPAIELPEYFEAEIGLPAKAHDVRVNDDGTVVGYVLEGSVVDALAAVRQHMEQGGWSEVPLGDVAGATFVKEGGSCEWALATCTQAGSSTCVVFRSVVA